jgi:outer membrane protein assembly factor BamA
VFAVVLASSLAAQSLPLESLVLEGTTMSRDAVLTIAGLRIGGPIDKAAIETACGKLTDTGLIQSISYRYARGPKRGWVLTLTIEDQKQFTPASIDFPGVDDAELWRWLAAQYPAFDHKVPANDPAQEFLAKALAEHAKAELDGQAVVTRMESDLKTRTSMISFQPANLPRIAAMNFTGQHELSADALTAVLAKLVADDGYTDRHFRQLVEINLRGAYEEHGMYRVKFPKIAAEKAGAGKVTVTTTIEEGAQFKLGEVSFVGDNLPVEAMLKAAKFKKGQIANWTEIQSGIWAAERPVKRTGYFAAAARPERILHDEQSVIDVKISFAMGPLFHAGQLKIIGLSPELEAKARKLWKQQPGDPYDFEYAGEFLKEFGQSAPLGQFRKITPSAQRMPDNVMDCTLLFESR